MASPEELERLRERLSRPLSPHARAPPPRALARELLAAQAQGLLAGVDIDPRNEDQLLHLYQLLLVQARPPHEDYVSLSHASAVSDSGSEAEEAE